MVDFQPPLEKHDLYLRHNRGQAMPLPLQRSEKNIAFGSTMGDPITFGKPPTTTGTFRFTTIVSLPPI